jgi:hypothetical protein
VTVPVAWIKVPVGTVSVMPNATVKLVHWMSVVGGLVTQLVLAVISQTPTVVASEPSP